MAKNKQKSTFSLFVTALVISLVFTVSLAPVMRLLYPLQYEDEIIRCAEEYSLDKYLIMGIISSESNFRQEAVSHKSAIGLMQIKEDTARWCIDALDVEADAENISVPEVNIELGSAYISYLLSRYGNDVSTAVAAYNAGPGNVEKWLSDVRYSKDSKTLSKIPFANFPGLFVCILSIISPSVSSGFGTCRYSSTPSDTMTRNSPSSNCFFTPSISIS